MPRARGVHKGPTNEVATLQSLVDRLIKENKQLRREIAKAADRAPADLRPIAALLRKVERAISAKSTASTAPQPTRRPRKPASPETIEKRRQALAKARAVRAERRQAES